MPINVCPIARLQAPLEKVWALLSDPTQYSTWMDASTRSIEPGGKIQPGQVILASSRAFGRQWDLEFDVLAVDESIARSIFGPIYRWASACITISPALQSTHKPARFRLVEISFSRLDGWDGSSRNLGAAF